MQQMKFSPGLLGEPQPPFNSFETDIRKIGRGQHNFRSPDMLRLDNPDRSRTLPDESLCGAADKEAVPLCKPPCSGQYQVETLRLDGMRNLHKRLPDERSELYVEIHRLQVHDHPPHRSVGPLTQLSLILFSFARPPMHRHA